MLLLREGLPGWLTRAEQVLESKPGWLPSPEPGLSTTALARNLVTPAFEDWVRVLSSLLSPSIQQVHHEC